MPRLSAVGIPVLQGGEDVKMSQLQNQTGMQRRTLRKTLDAMVSGCILRIDGGRYVEC